MRKIVTLVVVAALLGAASWGLRRKFLKPAKFSSRAVAAGTGPIEETVEATGSVAPLNRVEIKPPIGGRMEQLLVDEGSVVKQGQILAWMSSSDRAAILDAARAKGPEELKRWQDTYKATPIVAPLSGVIILRNVVVGQTMDPNTVLFAMSDSLVVVAQVDESDIGRVRQGMPARIRLDAYPNDTTEGKVFDILYEGKNVSNVIQYGVKVRPERVPGYFRSQMTANVSFIVRKKEDAVLVPSTAVHDAGDGTKQVSVPGPDGAPKRVEVKTGIESADSTEIVSGLRPGDKVLLSAGAYVPQQPPQSSPLTMGGRPGGQPGQGRRKRN